MNLTDMLSKAKELQEQMARAKDKIASQKVEGDAGAGMVKVTMNGEYRTIKLDISDELFAMNDKKMLTNLVLSAINNAVDNVQNLQKDEMGKITGSLPNIPGFNF
jgi:hypothetical protein